MFSEGVICEEEGGAAVKVNAASSFRGCSSAPAGLAAAAAAAASAGATCQCLKQRVSTLKVCSVFISVKCLS